MQNRGVMVMNGRLVVNGGARMLTRDENQASAVNWNVKTAHEMCIWPLEDAKDAG